MNKRIKVGITGKSGFMGSHLDNFLALKFNEIELIDFKRDFFKSQIKLQKFVKSCDVIIHLAAINRHDNHQEIYNTNIDLTMRLISACEITRSTPKIIFSSSTQELLDNLYGKSKLDGRQYLEAWAKKSGGKVTSLIIPNVFGPFGKPFYNSFIATFSHQIINGEEPTLINDSIVDLIYMNELSEVFYNEIIKSDSEISNSYVVRHKASKKVSEILKLLKEFKITYIQNGQVPSVNLGSIELDLFNTFTSYIPRDYFPRKFIKHTDDRGSFVEIMRANSAGQSSYSTTVPGITRGDHFHTRKIERFAVINGKASIKMRKVNSKEIIEYILDGEKPSYVDMPVWYTHNITNIGNSELITLFWINEPYNEEDSDTYYMKV